jgi:hypothetical protein
MDFVNITALTGENGTGFEKRGNKGPFQCANCEHYPSPYVCDQKDMMRVSKQPKWPDGTVKVDPEDCCSFLERTGKFWRK